jgi:hypothetical protein
MASVIGELSSPVDSLILVTLVVDLVALCSPNEWIFYYITLYFAL